MLTDLLRHQAWADAAHWRAIDAWPAAAADMGIRRRQHHVHLVQRAFAWAVGDQEQPFAVTAIENFSAPGSLQAYGRAYHDTIVPALLGLTPAQLERRVAIPWFREPALALTVGQALLQCVMHSHYHRGQNATRLRELGGEPPLIDLIVWYHQGQPAAAWE